MTDFSDDDFAAMRRQGDMRAFISQQIADGEAKRDSKPQMAPPPRPPGYVAGVWPSGTQPPSPPPAHPAAAWQAALAEFREWALTATHAELARKYPCACGACPLEGGTTDGPSDAR